jgi:hypothetical protein
MTGLMEDIRLAVQEILQSIGLGGSASTAAAVVPVLMLGIALNLVALSAVDRVHPIRGKTHVVGAARAEVRLVQNMTICVLRQIEGREQGICSVKRCTSNELVEKAKCRIATGLSHVVGRYGSGHALPCTGHGSATGSGKTLLAI